MIDGNWLFGLPAITNSTTPTRSTDVVDVGTAKKVFSAPQCAFVCFSTIVTADADPSIKVDLVGADDAALTSSPVVLGSSGVIATDEDGTALVSGDRVTKSFPIGGQTKAKRFYGLVITLGGTAPDIAAAALQGYLTSHGSHLREET